MLVAIAPALRTASVDIVNAPALHAAVEGVLVAAPHVLRLHAPGMRAALRHAARGHRSVRPAHRRRADPAWAQDKFDAGLPLHRFFEREGADLAEDLDDLVALLAEMARLEGPGVGEARAFLRGLPHRRAGLRALIYDAETVLHRTETLQLLAGRRALVREPIEITGNGLVATRCRSLDAVIRLGQEARNCLADHERYWRRFAAGELDVWALRGGDGLAAVLAVSEGRVEEAFGPRNAVIGLVEAGAVARFCARMGWAIGEDCEGLLPQYAGAIRIGPLRLSLGGRVALYAEWADAVRIDLSRRHADAGGAGDNEEEEDEEPLLAALLDATPGPRILALAFDPARPCADAILYDADPRGAVTAFGAAALRRIVADVALGCAEPTVVQHRLLALAA